MWSAWFERRVSGDAGQEERVVQQPRPFAEFGEHRTELRTVRRAQIRRCEHAGQQHWDVVGGERVEDGG